MPNIVYTLGMRLLISNSRRSVRGSVIFFLAHLLLFAGIAFAAEIILLMLGVWGIHVPFIGQVTRVLGG